MLGYVDQKTRQKNKYHTLMLRRGFLNVAMLFIISLGVASYALQRSRKEEGEQQVSYAEIP